MVFLGTPNLLAASLFVMPFFMCDRMSHFFFQSFRIQLTFGRHFCFDDTDNKKQIFFIYGQTFCFYSNSNLFGNSKMKFEHVNVPDRERKWFKGPENLFDIGKSSGYRSSNIERLCSILGGNFKGPNILFETERYSR